MPPAYDRHGKLRTPELADLREAARTDGPGISCADTVDLRVGNAECGEIGENAEPMIGNLVAETVARCHGEPDDLRPATRMAEPAR